MSGLEANANLTLLYVAAEAQYNRAEASANIRVSGYVGPEAGKMFPEFGTFDIESYVKLMQSLSEMREVIGAKEEHIRPTRLWAWAEEETGATDRPTLLRVRTGRSAIVVDFAPSGPLQGPRRTVVGERSAENDNPERTPSARGARYLDAIQRDTGRE